MSEQSLQPDDSRLDAGLRAGFGPADDPAEARAGRSALAEIEGHLGTETRVFLRGEAEPVPQAGAERSPGDRPGGDSRYEAREEIARGGMGVIIRSHDRDLGRDVAMKVLQARHADNEPMVRRFVEEAQIAGQLQHPGVLTVYELGLQPDRRPYFTMRLIKGRTLAELLEQRRRPDEDRARFLSVFERMCQTMAYAHARGVIHRDLKPANVMVAEFGEVQIVDWGLAKLLPRGDADTAPQAPAAGGTEIRLPQSEPRGTQSLAGSVMGTPAYMPPEQARGEVDELDERADVFALGAILCEILTGQAPYLGDASEALDDAREGRLEGAWERLAASGADDELVALTRSCLAPRRRERLRDAGAVAQRFAAYLASVDERARKLELAAVEARARAVEERRRRRLTLVLAGTVLAAVVLGGSAVLWRQNERLKRIAAQSEAANQQVDALSRLLAQAKQTPVSEDRTWIAVRAAGANLEALRSAVELDEATEDRVSTMLDEFNRAERDRQLVERIEDLVIAGATHDDRASWTRMERRLREVFLEYGIDLDSTAPEEIAARIRASSLAPQLVDGLELWISANGYLGSRGGTGLDREQLMAWVDVLYDADPDPFRVRVRRQVYTIPPDARELAALARDPGFDTAPPRTLSWLGNCFLRAGDAGAMDDVYRRALDLHPTDFMLNFDYALSLAHLDRPQEAIRYYHRSLALRPGNGGVWHRLGVALESTGDLAGATDAYRAAVRFEPDLAIAHCRLGLALRARGDLAGALEALQRGHELGSANPDWPHPSGQWVEECRRLLEAAPGG
jgi:serine/threonine-protein kinase